jgi:PAS domain S-box-containing protein
MDHLPVYQDNPANKPPAWDIEEYVQHGIFCTDINFNVIYWNFWMEARSRWLAQSILGKNLFQLFPEIKENKLDKYYLEALNGQVAILSHKFHKFLIKIPTKSALSFKQGRLPEFMLQSVKISPLIQNSLITGTVTIIEDVTDRTLREEELRRRIALQEAINEINREIISLNPEECLKKITSNIASIIGAEIVCIVLKQNEQLKLTECSCEFIKEKTPSLEDTLVAWSIKTEQTTMIDNVQDSVITNNLHPICKESNSIICVPLMFDKHAIGAICVESKRPYAFSTTEHELLIAFSGHASVILNNALLHEKIKNQEEQLKWVLEGSNEGFWDWCLNTNSIQFNIRTAQFIECPITELPKTPLQFLKLIHPDDKLLINKAVKDHLRGKTPSIMCDIRIITKSGNIRWLHISGRCVVKNQFPIRIAGTLTDITYRKHIESEREQLIAQLKEALANIKTLSGLIPICANCKKIRDDQGYWNQIESYITEHSNATFTHSICPNCAKILYPELDLSITENTHDNEPK